MRTTHLRWTIACMVGGLLAAAAAGIAPLAFAVAPFPEALAGAGIGLVYGTIVAALQWQVLRVVLPRLRLAEWAVPTASIGAAVGATGAFGLAAGALLGAAQWLVLRRHARRAGPWIWIQALAWTAAVIVVFFAGGEIGGLGAGLVFGAISGVVARRLEPWVDERRSWRGRLAVVTGGTSGIGYEIALGLARLGARVVLLARDDRRAARARAAIAARVPGADVRIVRCDLASLASVRAAGAWLHACHPRVDVLVHAAGATFRERELTEDRLERTFAVDVAGPFLLTALLRPRLEAAEGRVVTLTGIRQRRGRIILDDLHFRRRRYSAGVANAQAQLGRVLFTAELARRAPSLAVYAVHPGAVRTRALRSAPVLLRILAATLLRPGFVRPELGALPALRLCLEPGLGPMSGRFFDRFRLARDRPRPDQAAAFWSACEAMVARRAPSVPVHAAAPST